VDELQQVREAVNPDRLVDTAVKLIEIPSPTRSAAKAAQCLSDILVADGFEVERPTAGWPDSPAVVCRWKTGEPGRTIQFSGHLDTVHLPFIEPRIENGMLYGSGCSDMKGGVAAMVEALRVLRETRLLPRGDVLITCYDLHEAPWGDGSQVDHVISSGFLGDAVLIPEYVYDRLPVAGRGLAVITTKISRSGEPVHEVLGGIDQPNVVYAAAEVLRRFSQLDDQLRDKTHPIAGRESIFCGKAYGGEIFNQSPTSFVLEGTRRWLADTSHQDVESQYRQILAEVSAQTGTTIDGEFHFCRDAYELDQQHPFLASFQKAHEAVTGQALPVGAKPVVDDGNAFVRDGHVQAITHGPNATGAHTLDEECPISELVRVAEVYALTAIDFC